MAIRFSDTGAYLRQAGEAVSFASDVTLFGWAKQVEALGTQDYQTFLSLFSEDTEDRSDPFVWVGIERGPVGGDLVILRVSGGPFPGDTVIDAPLPPLNTWFWWAVTYSDTTHQFALIVNGAIAGVATRGWTPFVGTSMTAGGDPNDAGTHVSIAYHRQFNAFLTAAELLTEAAKPLAEAASPMLDSSWQYVGDLTDYTANGHTWTVVGAPESDFNGPFGNPTAFAFATAPNATDLFFYDANCRLLAVTPAPNPLTERLVAVCPTRDGFVWAAYDVVANRAAAATSSILRKINPTTGAIVTTTPVAFVVAELRGRKALFELPSRNLLTVNRTTHALTSLDPTTGAVVQTYSLVVDPLDAALNADGTRLLFAES